MVAPNKKQQECITNYDGPWLVLAGPGTGKTFTVVRRIENMIKEGVDPEKILCLTFSETAAGEMKKGIDKQLGKIESEVNVYTYHGFCNEILNENPLDFELPENIRLIPSAVSKEFVKECIDEIEVVAYKTEKNDPYIFLDEIERGIHDIKQNRLTKEAYFFNLKHNLEWMPQLNAWKEKNAEAVKNGKKETNLGKIQDLEAKIAKVTELWDFYELYSKKMEKYHYIDFDDMISLVLDKFEKDSAFLSRIANQYEYILVDEYQDTNKAQNEIVFKLSEGSEKKNIFVVGDDDQIIFTFQGAKLKTIENFLTYFKEKLGRKVNVVCLEENMRSTQSILDVARKIVEQDTNRLEENKDFQEYGIRKILTAKNPEITKKDKKVRFYKYADAVQEYNEIINEIDELINSEECPKNDDGEKNYSEIAILTRSNNELETLAEMLKDKNIPYELKEGKNIFNIRSVVMIYYYMQFLTNPEIHSDKIYKMLLSHPYNIHPKDYETLYNIRSRHKCIVDCMRELKEDDCYDFEMVDKFIKNYDYLKEYAQNETIRNTLLEIGAKTGIFNYYLNEKINRTENIAGLKKLVDEAIAITEIHKTTGLNEFVSYLDTCIINDIAIKTEKAPVKMNAVQLSTYHSSKGKEFEYVYMPTLFNTKWESSRVNKAKIPLSPNEAKTDDEYKQQKYADCIRLLYVGMTRAKHTLRLSYYANTGAKTKLSEFIAKVQDMLEPEAKPFEHDENSYWVDMTKPLEKRDYNYVEDFGAMIDAVIKNKSFSATAINTYLNCPRQYFYNYILGLNSKADIADAANFGKAIHSACEFAVNTAIAKGEFPSKIEFIEKFRETMKTVAFSDYEHRKHNLERGEKALDTFYNIFKNSPVKDLYKSEYKLEFNLGDCNFIGYIDKLDQHSDGTFTIYDYKTGKAKTAKDIGIGKPYENYYNQIGLYKYFLEQATGKKVRETTFIFPEHPTENFTLELSDEDCIAIKDKFLEAIKNIKAHKFEPCEDRGGFYSACKYCGFKDFCEQEII